jgi:hypothetical protein
MSGNKKKSKKRFEKNHKKFNKYSEGSKVDYEEKKNKSLLVISSIFFILFLTSFISAETFTFDNVKSFQKTADSYGIATIRNSVLGIQTSDIMKVELKKNTDFCMINCSAEGTAELYQDAWLLSDAYFKDLNTGKDKAISYQIYIQDGTIKGEQQVKVCTEGKPIYNKLNNSYSIPKECHSDYITVDIPNWVLYKGEKLKKGKYNWKIEGQKGIYDNIDWIGEFDGVKVIEWASWNSGFEEGLVSVYQLNEGVNGTTTQENVSSIYNGTLNGNIGWNSNGIYLNASSNNGGYIRAGGWNYLDSLNVGSVSFWIYPTLTPTSSYCNPPQTQCAPVSGAQNPGGGWMIALTNSLNLAFSPNNGAGGYATSTFTNATSLNSWGNAVFTFNGTNVSAYLNGQYITSTTYGSWSFGSFTGLDIAGWGVTGTGFTGMLDEFYVWNRTLSSSEVNDLYNNGFGIFYKSYSPLTITLNSPIDYYNSSSSSITLNCSAINLNKVQNISLWVNGIRNYTLTNGVTNFSEIYRTLDLADEVYNWTCSADDNATITNTEWATNRTFIIDTGVPLVNITSILNTTYWTNYTTTNLINISLNFSQSDPHLESCWYYNQSANVSINCGENASVVLPYGTYTFWLYANDTLGLEASYNVTANWNYLIFQNNISYAAIIAEGYKDDFSVIINTSLPLTQSYLNFNGINYSSSVSSSVSSYSLSNSIYPIFNGTLEIPFYFLMKINGNWYATEILNQTIIPLNLSICSASVNSSLITFFLKDEKTTTLSINGSMQVLLNINSLNNPGIKTFNLSAEGINNLSICYSPSLLNKSLFYLDYQVKYWAHSYSTEMFNTQSSEMSLYPKNISLYDLNSTEATRFKITYKGNDFVQKEGYLIQLLRKYIDKDSYEIVEAPLTSSLGEAILSIDLNNNQYSIITSKNGIVYDTYENIIFACDNALVSLCTFPLDGKIETYSELSFEQINDVSYTVAIDENTNISQVTFSTISGNNSNFNLVIVKTDSIGKSIVYNNSVTASTGIFEYQLNRSPITFESTKYDYVFSKNNGLIFNKEIVIDDAKNLEWNNNNYFILIILILTLVGMAFVSAEAVVLVGGIGFIVGGILALISGVNIIVGIGGIIFTILGIFIIIHKMTEGGTA